MCTRFDSEVNSHTSTRKLVTTLIINQPFEKSLLIITHGCVAKEYMLLVPIFRYQ